MLVAYNTYAVDQGTTVLLSPIDAKSVNQYEWCVVAKAVSLLNATISPKNVEMDTYFKQGYAIYSMTLTSGSDEIVFVLVKPKS